MARRSNMRKSTSLSTLWLLTLGLARLAASQGGFQFTGAVQIVNGVPNAAGGPPAAPPQQPGSNAVPAQCPAANPVSCTNIQQPNFCCPAAQVCSWRNSVVACCPQGQTCTGTPMMPPQAPPSPPSYPQPTQAPKGPPPGAAGGYAPPSPTTQGYPETLLYGQDQYCSTLFAIGPNLPTTQAAPCGIILILPAEGVIRQALGWMKLLLAIVGLQVVGGMLLTRR